jgi:hypothetical protein
MISIKQEQEPHDIELPYGATVTVKPLTTPSMLAAQVRAKREMKTEHGFVEDTEERTGLEHAYVIYQLAATHIIAWDGVTDENDEPAPVTEENIRAFMDLYPVGEVFYSKIRLEQGLMNLAKKDSGVSVRGTLNETEAPNTAKPASS